MQSIIGNDITKASEFLTQGELVAIPTETVYGLAANALNPDAVTKIFEAKNRPHFNPLIVHVKNWDSVAMYVEEIPAIAIKLVTVFTPGPLTFLLKKKSIIPDIVTAGSDYVAIRIPNHTVALDLLSHLDFPLAAPSANQFGYISPTKAEHVMESLGGKIAYILEGGDTAIGVESTIIGFDDENNIILHRTGGVSVEEIEAISGKKLLLPNLEMKNKPVTSGQLLSHYAPDTSLCVGDIEALYQQHKGKRIALISFSNSYSHLTFAFRSVLSPKGSLNEAAQQLFATLRAIDKTDAEVILAEHFPNIGLGRAINDRLRRAQSIYKSS